MNDGNNRPLSKEPRVMMSAPEEIDLLKKYFKDNDGFLKSVRNLLFGFQLSENEKTLIKKTFSDIPFRNAFRKKLFPIFEIDQPDLPVGSLADFWYGIEQNIIGHSPDTIFQVTQLKAKLQKKLQDSMVLLEDPDSKVIDLTFVPSNTDKLQVDLLVRNTYVKTMNEGLSMIGMIANQKDPSETETKVKGKKNSTE